MVCLKASSHLDQLFNRFWLNSSLQALPDNLKLLFRPVAMTTPEFRLIAEVFLYSVGFIQVSILQLRRV